MSKRSMIWGSRRRFLKDIFKVGVSAPFVNSTLAASGLLWARSSLAQEGDTPLRYVLCFTPDGCGARETNWHADQVGYNFNLNQSSANFEPWKQRMIFMDGINGVGGHGDKKSFITGSAKQSIDSYLAGTIGAEAPYPWTGIALAGQGLPSRNATGNNVNPDTNPFSIYRRFFGTGEASVTIDGLDLTSARYVSVLDANREMINDVKLKLGQAQRQRFEEIQHSIEATEAAIRRKAANQTGSCSAPPWGGAGTAEDAALADGDIKADLLIEVIALAFKCDMTRSVAISMDRKDIVPVVNAELHGAAHDGKTNNARDCRLWLNSKLVKLMASLDVSTDTDGQTVLHNSLIHHVTDYGNGQNHDNKRAPLFLAGNAKGKLDVGRAIQGQTGAFFDVFDTVAQVAGVIDREDYPNYGGGNPMTQLIVG